MQCYNRRKTDVVRVGDVKIGGENPIVLQSMTNTSTTDTAESVAQIIRIVEAGGDMVRLTAQGPREAENLKNIKEECVRMGCNVPLVADIHFNPKVAEIAALYVDKVRINPGNFVDPARTFKKLDYTDAEYAAEVSKIRERLLPLLDICRQHHTAIRIGVNHGSLSDRIMNRYGDTPEGMVESCMEFLRVCHDEHFDNVVISIKASNPVVMVRTVRLLVEAMDKENMRYPLHLGVTEAGDGEDGRVKSAVGIGTLLAEGLGDTIRVSLSEAPEMEIPVARKLADYIASFAGVEFDGNECDLAVSDYSSDAVCGIGGDNKPVVIAEGEESVFPSPDFRLLGGNIVSVENKAYPIVEDIENLKNDCFFSITLRKIRALSDAEKLNGKRFVFLLETETANPVLEQRLFFAELRRTGCKNPVVLYRRYKENDVEMLQLKAAVDCGALLIDGLADGVFVVNKGGISSQLVNSTSFAVLQASHRRVTRTEYISCPGCGRTLYDLQEVIRQIKERTARVSNLKIGIMGCIVNGPGEMADSDYGYVGAARGKVSLYKKQVCVEKNIDQAEAVDKLVELIKANGDWVEN
ncbi:MAG: (E)-4-hydroxy-3-methylbut-2-enyl-diphosphate synthase [Paludibacteraceae bacterium]|nr:(E)-4-hydroxy-3-methylbut-2-enyl-diphosphate synthase [Paludibacteraceae bacterium]